MADHVDANPTKGAGKSPRVPRTRRASLIVKIPAPVPPTTSRVPLPTKRKYKRKESEERRGGKVSKLDEQAQPQAHSSRNNPSVDKSAAASSSSSSSSASSALPAASSGRGKWKREDKVLVDRKSSRFLRKRHLRPELLAADSTSSESDLESASTTDPDEETSSSRREKGSPINNCQDSTSSDGGLGASSRSATRTRGFGSSRTKSKSDKVVVKQRHRVSSGGAAGGSNSGGGSSSKDINGGKVSKAKEQKLSASCSSFTGSSSSSYRKDKKYQGKGKRGSDSGNSAAATSESQTSASETGSVSSRLRPTPSRAAAASQKAAEEASSGPQIISQAQAIKAASSTRASSPKSGSHPKQFRSYKQRRNQASGDGTSSSVPFSSETDELTEELDSHTPSSSSSAKGSKAAAVSKSPSSDGSSSSKGFRYQLRSRASIESRSTIPSSSTSGSSSKGHKYKGGRKGSPSSPSGISGAHILSEKERNLRRSSGGKGSGDFNSARSTGSSLSSVGGNQPIPGRSSGRGASAATSNNTGSCASSRCGRGGGPSSEEGPSSATVKSGEPGMSNPSSSGQQQQSSSSTTRGDQAEGGSGSGGAASNSGAAASAFSRGLAMLSGDTDTDEGEMGRLEALLESRGLPPHLFGSLAPRMQQLLHRGISNSTVTKAQQLLTGLQAVGDEGQQLQAAIEMCQLLVMGNEDTLAGFPVKQTVPALIQLLSMEHNFDIMNHACRALTYMMEALPRSTPVVAEAVPVFLEKLQVIQCMDVAEQSLTALEMLSRRHAKVILQARGVSACLTYLDFFSIVAQRASLSITANCCQNLHIEEFHLVAESLSFMATRLTQQDKKSVESVCLAFSRLVDSFNADPKRLEEIASPDLLANLQQLLVVTPPVVSTGTFILVLRMLSQSCSRSPSIAVKLLEQNIVGTLSSLLLGSSTTSTDSLADDVELVPRNPQELLEIVALIAELLPKLPKDGIFLVNTMMANPHLATQDAVQWQWKDDRGQWNSYSSFDSRIIEAAHQSGEDEISLSMQGRTYTIDFLGMQQINEDSGTARTVQRRVNSLFSLKSGPSSDNQEKVPSSKDERSSYLSVHHDFPLPFLRPLFALLSEANSSSAGPAVRQSCLKALLRIVHFLPSESLKKALKPQLVSNNLASMLASSDLKIVVGSFQLCCLLMEKLQDEFLIHFRREGVFHQISRISTSEVVGPSPMKAEVTSILNVTSSSLPSVSVTAGGSSNTGSSAVVGHMTNNLNSVSGMIGVPSLPVLPTVPHISIPIINANIPNPPPLTPLQMQIQPVPMHHPLHVPHLPPSPYSLCVGGFFMQQPGVSNFMGPSGMDNGNLGGGSVGALDTRDPMARQIINVQPIGHGISNVGGSMGSVIHSSPGASGTFSSAMGLLKTERGGSGSSSGDLSVETSSNANTPSSAGKIGHDKKIEDSTQALFEAFKRKRVSKRPIPTSTTSRRLRQDDLASGPVPNPNAGAATGSGSSGSVQVPKRGSKSNFFASLHPSRWTRGGSSSGAGASPNNNATSSSGNSHPERSHQVALHGHPGTPGATTNISSRSHNSVFSISYKEQVKSWLKEQSLAFTSKYCRTPSETGAFEVNSANDGLGMLPRLKEIIQNLRQESKMVEALKELRSIVVESDISSFEVNHSGLIGALLGYLTEETGYKANRDSRLRSFIHVFAECPLQRLSGEHLDAFVGAKIGGNALSLLVAKLNSCLAQLEQFQVKVHEVPTSSGGSRAAPTSALRFFNTHQLKCTLQRHPACTSLRQWKGGPVKIDSLALVQTIERYLIAKGFGRVRESRDSGDSEDDNSDDDIDDTLAAAVISQGNARHKLQFLIGEHLLPYNMTVYQAIRQFGLGAGDPAGELEAEFDPASAMLGSSGIWAQTHTIYYRPVPEDGGSANASSQSSSKSKKSKAPSAKNSSKSKKDPLWHEGVVSEPIPPYLSYLLGKLPESVSIADPCLPVLSLLRVIHAVCRFWRYLYWPVLSSQSLLPGAEFINHKVAAKAQRQLQDPVVIMTGNVPQWLQQIGVACPFLFPFETRQMLFYSITFDRDRALQRLLDSVPELNTTEREDRVTPRLDRRKRTISRDNILHHAEQLMSDFGSSRPLLEIQYENEVGTGLGPTLEFYALVSLELQKKELDLWHSESSVEVSIAEDGISDSKAKSYVHTSVGLFPKPLGKSVKASHVSKSKQKFKFLGKFMAKAVMDSRMIDLPVSKTLYKWILAGESSMCLADISDVDSTVAQSIRQLVSVVSQKKKLEINPGSLEINVALESLTLDGCRIDNLGLDFTLPGHPTIDLKKGGKDIPVTIHNLEDYIKLVCHWMLFGGVSRQMDSWREGFDSVFPSSSLRMFFPEELEMIFCGANQSLSDNWDVKTLMECCRADHGYTLESKAIQNLFEIMSSYNAQERRKFIQFVTGSPRLPVGGFRSLQPPLTIVRKTVEGLPDCDSYLPSVMTCVNYLKLPDYTTLEIMRKRLRVAVDEGQLSFHLS